MADTHTSNLCSLIIHSHFGPLTAKVASSLLTRGRLSLPQILRYTSLKPRTVRAAILILIQHNLVWHSQTEEDGEVFEFNSDECLLRLRFGTFVWQAGQLFGPVASEIVSLILDHGKLRPPDVMEMLCPGHSIETTKYRQTIQKLVSASYLVPSTVLFHISPRDKLLQYEQEEKNQIRNVPTAKALREAKERAEARLNRELAESLKIGLIKRKVSEQNGQKSSKKKIVEEDVLDNEVFFRVHAPKFNIHLRDRVIVAAVRERYNDSAATVMQATLKSTEHKSNITDVRSDGISTSSILSNIPDSKEITSGLTFNSTKKISKSSAAREYLGMLAAADNPTPAGRAASFVSFVGSMTGKVHVEFEIICRRLRRRVLESVARERYGDEAVRIIRMLLDNGKMGGEQIAKAAMMPATTVRALLTSLSADTLISIQEVPKGADRNPQRTIYLWYVDLPKAYNVLLSNFYKMLYNIGMRRRKEAEDPTIRAVLEKSERSDVKADPSLLSRVEREVLRSWEERRDKLTILEMRVEEAVFILRDLAVLGIDGN